MKVYPVKGKVLLADGKPLTSGRVVFVFAGNNPIAAEGKIAADGSYTLKSDALGEGAPEGKYQVRIEYEEVGEPALKAKPTRRSTNLPFPAKYTDEDSSGLTATVEAKENDLPPFNLTK